MVMRRKYEKKKTFREDWLRRRKNVTSTGENWNEELYFDCQGYVQFLDYDSSSLHINNLVDRRTINIC